VKAPLPNTGRSWPKVPRYGVCRLTGSRGAEAGSQLSGGRSGPEDGDGIKLERGRENARVGVVHAGCGAGGSVTQIAFLRCSGSVFSGVKDAEAPAYHPTAARGIGEAEARANVVEIPLIRVSAGSIKTGEDETSRSAGHRIDRGGIERILRIGIGPSRRIDVVAKTEIQGETRGNLPIVLKESRVGIGDGMNRLVGIDGSGVHIS
jgi:hypothetical protein